MIDPGLAGKTVLITGANHGIGAATACAFAEQGANVFITYYVPDTDHSPEELADWRTAAEGGPQKYAGMQSTPVQTVIDDIAALGGRAAAHHADLSDSSEITTVFDQCEAALGPVDILVCNHTYCVNETFDPARVTHDGFSTLLVSQEIIDAHFAVNSRAVALLMREYVERRLAMGAGEGCIINLSTDAAHAHMGNVSYAASKHAIESYSRSAAEELGRYGIRVNVVAPGPVQTGYIEPEAERDIAENTPLGRVGEPADIADAIVFLASKQAHWITGQLLYVGGGWRMSQ